MNRTINSSLLVFDQGNTLVKLGLYVNHELIEQRQFDTLAAKDLATYVEHVQTSYEDCGFFGISSGDVKALPDVLQNACATSAELRGPLTMVYKTPDTLGMDRLAMAASAYLEHKEDVLVVTMGTCITYNIVKNGAFIGGAISPGWAMRYRAMHAFTAGLPLAHYEETTPLVGTDTDESLRAGVDIAIAQEVDGMIRQYCKVNVIKSVVLCGGDAKRLSKPLKNYIFAPVNYELHALKRLHEYIETTGPL